MSDQPQPPHRLGEIPGAVVTGVFHGLSNSPILLALVLLNALTLGVFSYIALEVSKARSEIIESLIQRCGPRGDRSAFHDPYTTPLDLTPLVQEIHKVE